MLGREVDAPRDVQEDAALLGEAGPVIDLKKNITDDIILILCKLLINFNILNFMYSLERPASW